MPRPLARRRRCCPHSFSTYLQLPHFIIPTCTSFCIRSPLALAPSFTFSHFIYTPVYICHTFVFRCAPLSIVLPPSATFLTAFLCICQGPEPLTTMFSPPSLSLSNVQSPAALQVDFDCIFVDFVAILITLMKVLIAK